MSIAESLTKKRNLTLWFRYKTEADPKNYRANRMESQANLSYPEVPPIIKEFTPLHYANDKGAETSAIYHTIFSTCKMVGVSALEYLKKFFNETLTGRKDWGNLLPSTIALD